MFFSSAFHLWKLNCDSTMKLGLYKWGLTCYPWDFNCTKIAQRFKECASIQITNESWATTIDWVARKAFWHFIAFSKQQKSILNNKCDNGYLKIQLVGAVHARINHVLEIKKRHTIAERYTHTHTNKHRNSRFLECIHNSQLRAFSNKLFHNTTQHNSISLTMKTVWNCYKRFYHLVRWSHEHFTGHWLKY